MTEQVTNTSKFLSGDRVEATDQFGNYHRAPGVVSGFSKNTFNRLLVMVDLDCNRSWGKTSSFYASELTLLERPESPVPR